MSNYAGKTNINVQEITIIPITDEDEGTYGTALDLTGRARSASYTPNVKETKLYGDGEVQEKVIDATEGTLTLALNYLTDSDRQTLFGETAQNGSNVITGSEQPKQCVVIFKSLCKKDGSVAHLYKFFRKSSVCSKFTTDTGPDTFLVAIVCNHLNKLKYCRMMGIIKRFKF